MGASRIFGVVLLVAGLIVVALAYTSSQSMADQTKHFFTGNFRDKTTWMMLAGAIATVLGVIGVAMPSKRLAA